MIAVSDMESFGPTNLRDKVLSDPAFGEAVESAFRWLGEVRDRNVFESGCGDGSCCVLFALQGALVIGTDLNPKRIRLAGELAESMGVADRCTFILGRTEDCQMPSNSIDIVFSKSALQYMDRRRAMEEMVRVLKPGGSMALIENLPGNPLVGLYRFTRRVFAFSRSSRAYVDSILGYLGPGEISLLEPHFEAVELAHHHLTRVVTLLCLVKHPTNRALRIMDRALAGLDTWLLRALPSLTRSAWIVSVHCCRKRDHIRGPLTSNEEPRFN